LRRAEVALLVGVDHAVAAAAGAAGPVDGAVAAAARRPAEGTCQRRHVFWVTRLARVEQAVAAQGAGGGDEGAGARVAGVGAGDLAGGAAAVEAVGAGRLAVLAGERV